MSRGGVIGLLMLIVIGVIVGTALRNRAGTNAIFNGLGSIWSTGIKGISG